jgi:hypothetical protein
VYGQLGSLDAVPYGDVSKAQEAAKGIHLIRPEADSSVKDRVRSLLQGSKNIHFIGFGFDEDNVALLDPENFKNKRSYSTSFKLSPIKRNAAAQLGVQFDDGVEVTADELFNAKNLFGPTRNAPIRRRHWNEPQKGWHL